MKQEQRDSSIVSVIFSLFSRGLNCVIKSFVLTFELRTFQVKFQQYFELLFCNDYFNEWLL